MKMHILTIVKDDNEGLNRTLNSIAFQHNPSVEISITVIDGLSATCPSHVINKFHELNIKLIKREPKGIYNAMNEGLLELSSTCGEDECSVVFLNAGDFLSSEEKELKFQFHELINQFQNNYDQFFQKILKTI
jgi:hypothetical protein